MEKAELQKYFSYWQQHNKRPFCCDHAGHEGSWGLTYGEDGAPSFFCKECFFHSPISSSTEQMLKDFFDEGQLAYVD